MIAINGMPDHLYLFFGFQPVDHMSELIKENGLVQDRFRWQEGYGAFSYNRSHIDRVYNYVLNQKEHHRKKTFREEYIELLEKFDVDYDERYIFKPVEY